MDKNMTLQEIDSTLPVGSYYFSGNEAATEGAIAAGCRYYGGYPITPSSEIMERILVSDIWFAPWIPIPTFPEQAIIDRLR